MPRYGHEWNSNLVRDIRSWHSKSLFTEIFKPFFATNEEIGTGLGLTRSKRILEGHGGRIHIRSSIRLGKTGSIIEIALPAEIRRDNHTGARSVV
jgi:nitrogen fixation/metabolism regulation signal transduction histidine kinase